MTSSDRHEVICAIAADLFNENGSMEDAKLTPDDVQEIVDRYQGTSTYGSATVHVHNLMDIRMPTEEEIRIALFQVMGAQMASPENGSSKTLLPIEMQSDEQDVRPDLSDVCGQATVCPCSGCRNENVCCEPRQMDRDSAEIDYDDPINQG